MARPVLRTKVWLDNLHCNEDADGIGDGEPYLWTAMFVIDGRTVRLDDSLMLEGVCTFVGTSGSHGNLGDSDVGDGDTVPIPAAIGEFAATMVPIPVPDAVRPLAEDVAGVIGVVAILMEENQVLGSAAEAGHRKLNEFLEQAINGIIPTLGIRNQQVTAEQIAALTAGAQSAVRDAIVDAQGVVRNVLSFVDGDVNIGSKVFMFDHDALTNNYWDLTERFQRVVPDPQRPGQSRVYQDYRLQGQILGVVPDANQHENRPRSREVGAPAAAGSPTAVVVPALGVHDILYRAGGGHLREIWRDANGGVGTTDLTADAGAVPAADDPTAYVETSTGHVVAIYRGTDRRVRSLYWTTGPVGSDDLSGSAGAPAAAGRPAAYFIPAADTSHVVYRTTAGRLHELWWTPTGAVGHGDLSGLSDAPRPAGDPAAYVDTTRTENIVVFRAADQRIHSIYWAAGPVGHDDLSGFTGSPPAAGEPAAYYRAEDDSHQVVYRATDGRLCEIWWARGSNASWWDLSTPAGAPPAASDPSTYFAAGTKHVVYRSADGHLHEIWWVPGGGVPQHVDLTLRGLARLAVGRPVGFAVEAARTQHVAYRGTDGQVHEIRWQVPRPGGGVFDPGGVLHPGGVLVEDPAPRPRPRPGRPVRPGPRPQPQPL